MSTIKCVIVDDELHGRIVLKELLAKFCPDISIAGEADHIVEAYNLIKDIKPDLVFLDIQMPGGNGFSLLKKFEDLDFEVVFVTSYDQYAVTAFKFSALDYLLKPVEIDELKACVEKVKKRKAEKQSSGAWVLNLLNNLDETSTDKKLALHHKDKVRLINLSDVVCLEAESNYTTVYTNDGEKYTPARVLKDFELFLAPYPSFIRINKSVIVNIGCVTEYSKGEPCILYLNNGMEFEISRRKKAEMNERMRG